MMETNYFEQVIDSIAQADKVLVGIGNEMDITFPSEIADYFDAQKSLECAKWLHAQEHILQDDCYQNLHEMLKDKDYYIISLCTDDGIFRVFPKDAPIVTPCGGLSMLQCKKKCAGQLYPVDLNANQVPVCNECGETLIFNNIYADEYYDENGYLDKFADYKKWLQTTINKNLCILELGVGMRFPTVIRFAFDKLAYYNQKCHFYRVHETLFQHTAENCERGISIKQNAKEFLQSKSHD